MEGNFQKYFQHQVPKEAARGGRINLTWRWVVKHTRSCPLAPVYHQPWAKRARKHHQRT